MVLGKLTLSRICNDKIYIFKGVFFLLFRSALKMTKTKKVIVSKLFRLLFPEENFRDKKKESVWTVLPTVPPKKYCIVVSTVSKFSPNIS